MEYTKTKDADSVDINIPASPERVIVQSREQILELKADAEARLAEVDKMLALLD